MQVRMDFEERVWGHLPGPGLAPSYQAFTPRNLTAYLYNLVQSCEDTTPHWVLAAS